MTRYDGRMPVTDEEIMAMLDDIVRYLSQIAISLERIADVVDRDDDAEL